MTSAIQSGATALADPESTEEPIPQSKQQLGLTIRSAAGLPAEIWPDERISAIRQYAAKAATNIAQLAVFLGVCQRYQLDPIVGQLFLIVSDGQPKVTTGRDTWLSLIRREEGFQGLSFSTVHEKDVFAFKRIDDGKRIELIHEVTGVQRGALIGGYCLLRDRLLGDNIAVRELKDFNHLMSKFNWRNYKTDMLENRCIAAVARKQYGFPGLLIEGEGDDMTPDPNAPTVIVNAPTGKGTAGLMNDLKARAVAANADRPPVEEAHDVEIEQEGAGDGVRVAPEGAQRPLKPEETEPNPPSDLAPPVDAPVAQADAFEATEAAIAAKRAEDWERYKELIAKRTSQDQKLNPGEIKELSKLRQVYPEFVGAE